VSEFCSSIMFITRILHRYKCLPYIVKKLVMSVLYHAKTWSELFTVH